MSKTAHGILTAGPMPQLILGRSRRFGLFGRRWKAPALPDRDPALQARLDHATNVP